MADYISDAHPAKRRRSRSPHSSRLLYPSYRSSRHDSGTHSRPDSRPLSRNDHNRPTRSAKDLIRQNQLQEDERMRQWVSQEDNFVLKQAKKKAAIRVKEGRAKPIDWLAIILRAIDDGAEGDVGFEEVTEEDLDFRDPQAVFENLGEENLAELRRDIGAYENLETSRKGREYWRTMAIICKDEQRRIGRMGPEGRATGAVQSDIDRLLSPKSYKELEVLEEQIRAKLDSNEPIDTDYWGQLLSSLLVWKAKAKLKTVWRDLIENRMEKLRTESGVEADRTRRELAIEIGDRSAEKVGYTKALDPDPLLQLPAKDSALVMVDETTFLEKLTTERQQIMRQGYVPLPRGTSGVVSMPLTYIKSSRTNGHTDSTTTAFDKLVARGVDEDEEVFSAEEPATAPSRSGLRKPLYFNRVQLGYDWNKYNQTHYDADNPPPRVVQGYKFHIFYPDLVNSAKAPTYKIIRENGRKKGESLAAAGEEDMCIIRFSAGPPYDDVAFRIVDRDWDYSGKEGRGFRSVFEKGVLTLWFSFKKVYYRK